MTYQELETVGFVEHHCCGFCGVPVGYQIHPDLAAAVFVNGCGCSGGSGSYRILTHAELTELEGGHKELGE